MSGRRPGSHGYDTQRMRERDRLENSGQAVDGDADARANEILQRERGRTGILRSARGAGPQGDPTAAGRPAAGRGGLRLRSSAFSDHDLMPERLSREGGNLSPPLEWDGVPDTAEELVLLCEDPDAPGAEPFLHWLVTGIDPHSRGVAEGQTPAGGREWPNDYGEAGWGGPRPPRGDDPHRYVFRVVAVDEPLALPENPESSDVHRAIEGHELAGATMIGTFAR